MKMRPRKSGSHFNSLIMEHQKKLTRREALRDAAQAGLGGLVFPDTFVERAGKNKLIIQENKKPGSTDWQLTRVRYDQSNHRSPFIEGYCSKQSVKAGEAIDIM